MRKSNLYKSNKDLLLSPGSFLLPKFPTFSLLLYISCCPILFSESRGHKRGFLPSQWALLESGSLWGNRTRLSKIQLFLIINHGFYWNVDLPLYLLPFEMSVMLLLHSLVLSLDLSQSFPIWARTHTHTTPFSPPHWRNWAVKWCSIRIEHLRIEQWSDEANHTRTLTLHPWKKLRIHWHLS